MKCHLVFAWIALEAQFWGKVATATTNSLPPTNPKKTYLQCYECDSSQKYKLVPPCIQGKNGTIKECSISFFYCETQIERSGTVTHRGCAYSDNPGYKRCYEHYDGSKRCLCDRCSH